MNTDVRTAPKGALLGGILLVAGCCIGAGMLGLPTLSAMAGFEPSLWMFLLCWLYMVSTGFLLLEVNLWFGEEINIVSMAERTLGKAGKFVAWGVFLFLFYSLMVAYVAASGSLLVDFIQETTGVQWHTAFGSFLFTACFGLFLYFGTGAVDWFNRILMLGLIIAYVSLVIAGGSHVRMELLQHKDWSAATLVIPAVIVSFGFHNLIPSLTTYFRSDVKALKKTIVIGSAIPLVIYLIWEWLILGIVPFSDFKQVMDSGGIATEALNTVAGTSWILDAAEIFAFFAIITSFLSVSLSFVDFLSDGLKIKKTTLGRLLLIFLALTPPYLCALVYPDIFLSALNAAGGFGAVILFGILPALMVWRGRYIQHLGKKQLLPGGRIILTLLITFALAVMTLQLM